MDFLYPGLDFSGPGFQANASVQPGDGGLSPGKLVFAEDLENFTGKSSPRVLAELNGGRPPESWSIGGPSIVSLIHAAQVLSGRGSSVRYYGALGTDEAGRMLKKELEKFPLEPPVFSLKEGNTARTEVLSDPNFDKGQGERTFIHSPGASSFFSPEDVPEDFFNAHIAAFGGTALVPPIHAGLTSLLKKARKNGAVTVVNLVYDYRGDRRGRKWTLGSEDDAYPFIDILLGDREEALKTSGQSSIDDGIRWFLARGVRGVIVTNGAKPITFAANPGFFRESALTYMPVCEEISQDPAIQTGDTTGCGDNFAGGVIAALTEAFSSPPGTPDLREICVPAIIAGGFARLTLGGVYSESYPGEKRDRLASYTEVYRKTVL